MRRRVRVRGLQGIVAIATIFGIAAVAPHAAGARDAPSCAPFADALRDAGEKEAARKAYVAILRRDPARECAQTELSKLNAAPPAPAACAEADALRQAGLEDEARAAYAKVLAEAADPRCATTGLEELDEKGFVEVVEGWSESGVKVIGALIGSFAVGVALWLLVARWIQKSDWWLARSIRRRWHPRLKLEAFAAATGQSTDSEAFAAALRHALASSDGEAAPTFSLQSISGLARIPAPGSSALRA